MNATGPTPPATPVRATGGAGLVGIVERLWCLLGNHVPEDTMVWHAGYGFAHCRRCHQPIVRSLLSDWTVPGPHLRIVWDRASNRPAPATGAPQPTIEAVAPVAPPAELMLDTLVTTSPDLPRVRSAGPMPVVVHAVPKPTLAANASEPRKPKSLLAVAEPVDLLGPHFMGAEGAPPGPSEGLSVFEFDDMAEAAVPNVSAAAGGAR